MFFLFVTSANYGTIARIPAEKIPPADSGVLFYNPAGTPVADGVCLRSNLLPMCPVRTDQSQQLSGWPGCGHQGSRRRHLARQLYGLRFGLYRSVGKNAAAPRKPLRAKSVTHVLGTISYPCVRSGTVEVWGGWRDLNPRHPEPQSGATTN
jgi:hypothetical protein